MIAYYEEIYKGSTLSSSQAISVEENKVVSTVTLQATAEILKDGVTCEVSNEYGTESKSFPVAIKKGLSCDFAFLVHPSPARFSSQRAFDVRWWNDEESVRAGYVLKSCEGQQRSKCQSRGENEKIPRFLDWGFMLFRPDYTFTDIFR